MSEKPQSPISKFHPQWSKMSIDGKRNYLIATHQADTWREASSMLARHGAICRQRRKMRAYEQSPEKLDRDIAAKVDSIKSVTVKATCQICEELCYTVTQFEDGSRKKVDYRPYQQPRHALLCDACASTSAGQAMLSESASMDRRAA